MARYLIQRSAEDLKELRTKGDYRDSRKAAWAAISAGSEVIADIQTIGERFHDWTRLAHAMTRVDPLAKKILSMRRQALERFKQAPHHRQGFRMSRRTGAAYPRPVNALCLISGNEGQEIPGLVRHDRVVVDAEHMEQALGPATVTEIFGIRKKIGEQVYISTNVSETPQIVRRPSDGSVDTRSTSALTGSKVLAALGAGADVVKVGFANLDEYKRDLKSAEVLEQMRLVRREVDRAVRKKVILWPLNKTSQFPLIAVFFPEIGIDTHGESPYEIAERGIALAAQGGWQGVLIDTFDKRAGRAYKDFYSLHQTKGLAALAHKKRIELWVAGSIKEDEVADLVRCRVDLICFGGAARHRTGRREEVVRGKEDLTIKRPRVEALVREFERADPRPRKKRR